MNETAIDQKKLSEYVKSVANKRSRVKRKLTMLEDSIEDPQVQADDGAVLVQFSHNPHTYENRIWCDGRPLRKDNPLLSKTGQLCKWIDKFFDELFYTSDADRFKISFYGSSSDYNLLKNLAKKHCDRISTVSRKYIALTASYDPYSKTVISYFRTDFSGEKFMEQSEVSGANWAGDFTKRLIECCNVYAGVKITFNHYRPHDYQQISESIRALNKNLRKKTKAPHMLVDLQGTILPYENLFESMRSSLPSKPTFFAKVLLGILEDATAANVTGKLFDYAKRLFHLQPTAFFISNNDDFCSQVVDEMKKQEAIVPPDAELYYTNEVTPNYEGVKKSIEAVRASDITSSSCDAVIFLIGILTDEGPPEKDATFMEVSQEVKFHYYPGLYIGPDYPVRFVYPMSECMTDEHGNSIPLETKKANSNLQKNKPEILVIPRKIALIANERKKKLISDIAYHCRKIITENYSELKLNHYRRAFVMFTDFFDEYQIKANEHYLVVDFEKRIKALNEIEEYLYRED